MNVTFVCNEYPPAPQGGIGTFVYHLSHALHRRGHKITVVGLHSSQSEVDDDGIRVVTLRARNPTGFTLLDRKTLANWLADDATQNATDVIEVPDFDGMMPYTFEKCPVVVRLHMPFSAVCLALRRPPGPLTYYCERKTLRQHPSWIAPSRFVFHLNQRLFLLRPKRSRVIHHFAPPLEQLNTNLSRRIRSQHGDYALFVGKLLEFKGALALAQAARLFLPQYPRLRVVYLGRDSNWHGTRMSDAIRETLGPDLKNRVIFCGDRPHDEVLAWMRAAQVFVAPSRLEAFSMTVVEALQCGVPVIFTTAATGPELIEHGREGFLVDPTDPQQIADAVRAVLGNPAKAAELIENGRRKARNCFSMEQCVEQTLAFYLGASCVR